MGERWWVLTVLEPTDMGADVVETLVFRDREAAFQEANLRLYDMQSSRMSTREMSAEERYNQLRGNLPAEGRDIVITEGMIASPVTPQPVTRGVTVRSPPRGQPTNRTRAITTVPMTPLQYSSTPMTPSAPRMSSRSMTRTTRMTPTSEDEEDMMMPAIISVPTTTQRPMSPTRMMTQRSPSPTRMMTERPMAPTRMVTQRTMPAPGTARITSSNASVRPVTSTRRRLNFDEPMSPPMTPM
jgi:hypothetical protein